MRSIRVTAAAGIALVVLVSTGCGSGSSAKSTAAPERSTTTAPVHRASLTPTTTTGAALPTDPTAPANTAATCRPKQLSASITSQAGGAGHGEQIVVLTDTGTTSCILYGYPGLGFLNTAGQAVPLTVIRATAPGMFFPAIPMVKVALSPGGEQTGFGMEWINGPASGTYSLHVTPPNDTGYLVVPNQVDEFSNNQVSVTPIAPLGQLSSKGSAG